MNERTLTVQLGTNVANFLSDGTDILRLTTKEASGIFMSLAGLYIRRLTLSVKCVRLEIFC